jgi:prepilin-type N-terminal cleavage/methylation domain-containing protein
MSESSHFHFNRFRSGFTLVELLVVIAIIGILIGMLLPAVQQVREAARRIQCGNNEKQIAIAIHNYEGSYMKFPPGSDLPGQVSGHRYFGTWVTKILPFVEQENLLEAMGLRNHVNQLNVHAPSSSVFNFAADNDPPFMNCPSDPNNQWLDEGEGAYGNYAICATNHFRILNGWYGSGMVADQFKNGIAHIRKNIKIGEIYDGTSNTILLSEVVNVPLNGQWGPDKRGMMFYQVEPTAMFSSHQPPNTTTADRSVFGAPLLPIAPLIQGGGFVMYARGYHVGGVNCTAGDASVHFVTNNVNEIIFQNLGGINDGASNSQWQ